MSNGNNQEPLITISVAVYNPRLDYFEECMQSILRQTYSNIEVILVDDGSTGEVANKCDEYAALYERVRVIHKENAGLPSARNTGIEEARGEYLAFVDNDDKIDNDFIETCYEEIIQNNADLVITTFNVFADEYQAGCYYKGPKRMELTTENIWKFQAMMLDALIFDELQYSLCMTAWGKLYRREVFEKHPEIRFNPVMKYGGEDNDFLQRMLPKLQKTILIDHKLYFYRNNEQSMTSRYNPQFSETQYDIMKILEQDVAHDNKLHHAYMKYCCNDFLRICLNYVFNDENPMTFRQKRDFIKKHLLAKVEYQNALKEVSAADFSKLKYLFMYSAKKRWITMLMVLAWGYKH